MTKRRTIRRQAAYIAHLEQQLATVMAENRRVRNEIKALHERPLVEWVRDAHARTVRRFTRAELAEEEAV